MTLFKSQMGMILESQPMRLQGRVVEVAGLTILAEGIRAAVGRMCRIERSSGTPLFAQVIGFKDQRTILMALEEPLGVASKDAVITTASMQTLPVGNQMLGRVIDALGRPMDGRPGFAVEDHYPLFIDAPTAFERLPIDQELATGIRAIDAVNTLGSGQRLGVFAGTGVGKSVLMGMIARYTSADVIVVCLVGERGREVGDFLRKDLGPEGLARSVLVVSTSDQSPVLRLRAGFAATAVAEYFRDQGLRVLLLMDSTTRMAQAARQIGLAAGEPPATKGYPPSVFAQIPRLLERSGRTRIGSITGLYTVLVEGDDPQEPIADAVRGTLDGHIWLSRDLANAGHYPAVSPLDSVSRLMVDLAGPEHLEAARSVRRVLAVWKDIEDLVNIGAYAQGTNPEYDMVVAMRPRVMEFLRQNIHEPCSFEASRSSLIKLHQEMQEWKSKAGRGSVAAKPVGAALRR